jgi:hypothetical protein
MILYLTLFKEKSKVTFVLIFTIKNNKKIYQSLRVILYPFSVILVIVNILRISRDIPILRCFGFIPVNKPDRRYSTVPYRLTFWEGAD